MKPIVVVAGIMDTKGKELLYIRDRVRVMGCDTLMIELSLSDVGSCVHPSHKYADQYHPVFIWIFYNHGYG